MEITPIILLCSIACACVSLFYLFKALKQFNEKNGKVQSSKVSIAYLLLNICTFAMYLYCINIHNVYYNDPYNDPYILEKIPAESEFGDFKLLFYLQELLYPGIIYNHILLALLVLLIPVGTIQLLLWDKLGLVTVSLGSIAFLCIFGVSLVVPFLVLLALLLIIQLSLLFVKKDGINSWSQLEFGFSFRKLKLLYLLFAAIILLV